MIKFKTKDLRIVLYSIVRQLKLGDNITYKIVNQVNDKEKYKVSWILPNTEQEAAIGMMKDITAIRKELNKGNKIKVVLSFVKELNITIYKEEEYYIIDNFERLFKYILFEMIRDSKEMEICINSNDKLLSQMNYTLVVNYSTTSLFYVNVNEAFDEIFYDIFNRVQRSISSIINPDISIKSDNYYTEFTLI